MAKMTLRDQMCSFDKLFHIIVRSSKGTLRQSTMTLIHDLTVSEARTSHLTCTVHQRPQPTPLYAESPTAWHRDEAHESDGGDV